MRRPLRFVLSVVAPVAASAALTLTLGGLTEDAVALKPARAGRAPVAQGADGRLPLESGQSEILAAELEPSADPAQRPAHGGRAEAREPSLRGSAARYGGVGIQGDESQGDDNGQQPGEQPVARVTGLGPFGGGGAVATPPAAPPSSPALQPAPGSDSGPTAIVEFLALSRSGTGILPGESFSVGWARDLKILVWWNLIGSHRQRLELRSPDGALYQRLGAQFDADTERYERRGSTSSFISVETLLPVAGTWITDYSLFGTWTVDVYLDDATSPITSATFSLSA